MKSQPIDIEIETKDNITITFENVDIEVEIDQSSSPPVQPYEGSYEVLPSSEFQLLPTAEKTLEDDILVHPIPYSEVSNIYGGYTATIGS